MESATILSLGDARKETSFCGERDRARCGRGIVSAVLSTRCRSFLVDPAQESLHRDTARSLALIDLDGCASDTRIAAMPPFPVIGFGNRDHPLAATLDVLLESPMAAEQLIEHIERAPHAAAVTVQLLRTIEGIDLQRALTVESLAYGLLQGSSEYAAWLAKSRAPTPSAHAGKVRIERCDAELRVVLDRPTARNAIDRAMRDGLYEAFTVAANDSTIRTLRLRAVGKVFSAGGDLTEFGTTKDPATAHGIRCATLPAMALVQRVAVLDVHVQGPCVGAGLEIAAFAPRLTASRDAWFQLPELAMGLLPGAGGCVSVPRRIGRQRAASMMLSGQRIDAPTALAWGLIDAIEDEPAVD